MRKGVFFGFVLAVVLALPALAKDDQIAYVNPVKLMSDYKKAQDYEADFQKSKEDKLKSSKLEDKANEIKEMQKKMDLLKEDQQEKEKQKIMKAIEEYRTLERKVFNELKDENDKRAKEVLTDIEDTIAEYAKKSGFSVVLDGAAVLYIQNKGADVTEGVLKQLNSNYSKGKKK